MQEPLRSTAGELPDPPDLSRASTVLELPTLADGSMLHVPLQILAGSERHPCVVLIAAVHGDGAEGRGAQ